MQLTTDRLQAAHVVVVAGVTAYLGFATAQAGLGPIGVALCCLTVASQGLVPRYPQVALCVFLLAAYGVPRYSSTYATLLQSGLLNWLAVLSLLGWIVWLKGNRIRPAFGHWLTLTMVAFIAWGGICMLAAWHAGRSFTFAPGHHPEQFLQALVLLVVAAHTLSGRGMPWQFILVLCALPTLRGLQQGNDGIYLDADVAALSVMAFPVALLAMSSTAGWGLRLAFAALALDMLRIFFVAQNRGAALGFACALTVLWWNSRYRARWLLAVVPLVLVGALLVPRPYMDRFRVLWDPSASHKTAGLDRATVESRKDLWSAGVRIIRDHPWLGVGPGNYPKVLKTYLPSASGYATHNSLLNVATETGLPGLALYATLFLGALILLQATIQRASTDRPETGARMAQAALAAYVGVGLVISRHDMQLAYLILGWAVALDVQQRNRTNRSVQPGGGAGHQAPPGGF